MVQSLMVLNHTIRITMTIQVLSGRNLQEQHIEPLNGYMIEGNIMHLVIIVLAKGSISFTLTILEQTLWKTKWSSLFTKWSPKGIIYIFIVMNSMIL